MASPNATYASRRPSWTHAKSTYLLCTWKRSWLYPLAHVVTHCFILVMGASMADLDALFSGPIPTKSSLAWWVKKPLLGPGKRTLSTLPKCSWTRPAVWWMAAHYFPSPCSQTLSKAHMLKLTTPWWRPAAYIPATAFLRRVMNCGTRITGQLWQPTISLHTWPITWDIKGCLCLNIIAPSIPLTDKLCVFYNFTIFLQF